MTDAQPSRPIPASVIVVTDRDKDIWVRGRNGLWTYIQRLPVAGAVCASKRYRDVSDERLVGGWGPVTPLIPEPDVEWLAGWLAEAVNDASTYIQPGGIDDLARSMLDAMRSRT